MAPRALIGISGWSYPHWREGFYAGIPRNQWLRHCADTFNALEINASFYRLQAPDTLRKWYGQTPPTFRFAMKGNRFLTHNRKLREPASSVALEAQHAAPLADKLAAVVWQLPQNFGKHAQRLEVFADALGAWRGVRHALEFRHPSWFDDETATCLQEHHLAVCISDAADWPMWDAVTTDLVYIRLHGHTRTWASAYSSVALRGWARRIEAWLQSGHEVQVYFDNDAEGAAPCDALRLMELLGIGASIQH
ncbi:MAG: DUF72 domain-containing protein [Pseudomonadota bacterium]|nr:MAG: DUF72 domain-containing protein [Pseudomonadota bacterium]